MRISDWSSDVCSSDLRRQQQDEHGGLQVKTPGGWIAAPPLPGTLVCNIGDMLDRLTGGWYLSTPHRVRNARGRERSEERRVGQGGFSTRSSRSSPDHVKKNNPAVRDRTDAEHK